MTTINEQAQAYRKRLFPGFDSPLASTRSRVRRAPRSLRLRRSARQRRLDDRTRMMAILAALIGAQAIDLFKAMAKAPSTWASRRWK